MTQTTLRLPADLADKTRKAAEANYIPVHSFILQAIKEKLERDESKAGVGEAVRDVS